jgi:hypothetical protein
LALFFFLFVLAMDGFIFVNPGSKMVVIAQHCWKEHRC